VRVQFIKSALAVIATLFGINWSFRLISSPSDVAVMVGLLALVMMVALWLPIFRKMGKSLFSLLKGDGMKSLLLVVVAGLFSLSISGCTRVEPGHVGIEVNYYGQERGVQDYPIKTGMVWYNPISSDVLEYPTFVQTAVWTKSSDEGNPVNEEITFNSKEGLVISGDISLSYQLDAVKVPNFYVKFRNDDLKNFTHMFLRNVARDHFNEVAAQYTVEELYGQKKEEFLKVVRQRINSEVEQFGISIQQFGFVGAPRLPEAVVQSLNNKIKATQDAIRVENELRQEKAEAEKKVARARGEALSNEILTRSITPTLLQWRRLEVTRDAVAKWDGRRPMVEGQSSGLLLQINAPDQK